MDFVAIDGTEVRMLDFAEAPDEVGGKMQRTVSGQRRGDVLWRARGWAGTAYCALRSESDALRVLAAFENADDRGAEFSGKTPCTPNPVMKWS